MPSSHKLKPLKALFYPSLHHVGALDNYKRIALAYAKAFDVHGKLSGSLSNSSTFGFWSIGLQVPGVSREDLPSQR